MSYNKLLSALETGIRFEDRLFIDTGCKLEVKLWITSPDKITLNIGKVEKKCTSKEFTDSSIINFYLLNKLKDKIPNFSYLYGSYLKDGIYGFIYENYSNMKSLLEILPKISETEFLQILSQIVLAFQEAYGFTYYLNQNLSPEDVFVIVFDREVFLKYSRGYVRTKYLVLIQNSMNCVAQAKIDGEDILIGEKISEDYKKDIFSFLEKIGRSYVDLEKCLVFSKPNKGDYHVGWNGVSLVVFDENKPEKDYIVSEYYLTRLISDIGQIDFYHHPDDLDKCNSKIFRDKYLIYINKSIEWLEKYEVIHEIAKFLDKKELLKSVDRDFNHLKKSLREDFILMLKYKSTFSIYINRFELLF